MTYSKRLYVAGVTAVLFLAMLLLLAQTLPNDPKPYVIKPIQWSPDQDMGEHGDSGGRTMWKSIDWSQFAYVQYTTNLPYLCNSVMLFESLHRLGCKPDRLMMYPSGYSLEDNSTESRLMRKARDEYSVILKPVEVQRRETHESEPLDEVQD